MDASSHGERFVDRLAGIAEAAFEQRDAGAEPAVHGKLVALIRTIEQRGGALMPALRDSNFTRFELEVGQVERAARRPFSIVLAQIRCQSSLERLGGLMRTTRRSSAARPALAVVRGDVDRILGPAKRFQRVGPSVFACELTRDVQGRHGRASANGSCIGSSKCAVLGVRQLRAETIAATSKGL